MLNEPIEVESADRYQLLGIPVVSARYEITPKLRFRFDPVVRLSV